MIERALVTLLCGESAARTVLCIAQILRRRAVVGCGTAQLCGVLEMLGGGVRLGRPAGVGGFGYAPTIAALLGANAGVRIEP